MCPERRWVRWSRRERQVMIIRRGGIRERGSNTENIANWAHATDGPVGFL
jgi:hypothetical protein